MHKERNKRSHSTSTSYSNRAQSEYKNKCDENVCAHFAFYVFSQIIVYTSLRHWERDERLLLYRLWVPYMLFVSHRYKHGGSAAAYHCSGEVYMIVKVVHIFFFHEYPNPTTIWRRTKKKRKNTAYKHTGDTGSKHIWPISYIDFYMCINVNFLIWICFIYLFIFSSSSSLSLDCCMFHHFAANSFVSLDLRAHTHLSLEVKELSVDIAETQWDKLC